MERMILQLRDALQKRGLSLRPTKCQVQTNDPTWANRGELSLEEGFAINFLDEGASCIAHGRMKRTTAARAFPNVVAATFSGGGGAPGKPRYQFVPARRYETRGAPPHSSWMADVLVFETVTLEPSLFGK